MTIQEVEQEPAKVISFINMKGGVGKTTLTKEIGYHLWKYESKRILFIDLDPQSNLTQSFFKKNGFTQEGLIPDEPQKSKEEVGKTFKKTSASIHKLFKPGKIADVKAEECILKLDKGLHLIPGTLQAVFLERNSNIENHLFTFIKNHSLRKEYDFIFIDCPPTYSNYTIAALISSDFYITPSKPDAYSVLGIKMLSRVVEDIKDHHQVYFENKPLNALGVVISETQPSSSGIVKMIDQIKSSTELRKIDTYFFNNHFVYNSQVPKQAEYFIADSKSATLEDLTVLVDEFKRRLLHYE